MSANTGNQPQRDRGECLGRGRRRGCRRARASAAARSRNRGSGATAPGDPAPLRRRFLRHNRPPSRPSLPRGPAAVGAANSHATPLARRPRSTASPFPPPQTPPIPSQPSPRLRRGWRRQLARDASALRHRPTASPFASPQPPPHPVPAFPAPSLRLASPTRTPRLWPRDTAPSSPRALRLLPRPVPQPVRHTARNPSDANAAAPDISRTPRWRRRLRGCMFAKSSCRRRDGTRRTGALGI